MLVLSRHKDEAIIITHPDGTKIKLLIADVNSTRVRLGFEAPNSIRIDREEVHVKRQEEGNS